VHTGRDNGAIHGRREGLWPVTDEPVRGAEGSRTGYDWDIDTAADEIGGEWLKVVDRGRTPK
jgi:hypothetical protein